MPGSRHYHYSLSDSRLLRQVDECTLGGPISVAFSNIFCVKMGRDVVKPLKPKLEKRYVDDIYSNQPNILLENLSNYHLNIKLIIEENPSKFLDTKMMVKNCTIETSVAV